MAKRKYLRKEGHGNLIWGIRGYPCADFYIPRSSESDIEEIIAEDRYQSWHDEENDWRKAIEKLRLTESDRSRISDLRRLVERVRRAGIDIDDEYKNTEIKRAFLIGYYNEDTILNGSVFSLVLEKNAARIGEAFKERYNRVVKGIEIENKYFRRL